ncbi:MAG TPA: AMP-binding protein [Gemmataceae bacterium]|nr:AMP-binding protein [Gemmataceae bacterium]
MAGHFRDGAWTPSPEFIATTNLAWLMREAGVDSYDDLHRWSVTHRDEYWRLAIQRLGIRFDRAHRRVLDLSTGIERPRWLPGAKFNIVDSSFLAHPDSPAIVHQSESGTLRSMTVAELEALTANVVSKLAFLGFGSGDAIAIVMPMRPEAVAIYLGILRAGCVAVGIADSFRPPEIAARLRISNAVAVFTQDVVVRGGKTHPIYKNVVEAGASTVIVLPANDPDDRSEGLAVPFRSSDFEWTALQRVGGKGTMVLRGPDDPINILFSSGTTGDPKAIPWTQTTPIKCGADAHFHMNVKPGDVLVWPTNLGWMMGPWLIFAALLNRATIGLFGGAPTGRAFGQFVQDAGTTMLGVVPSLVRTWRTTGCMAGLDWSRVQVLASTGECSCADDMRWLMELAGGKPIVEYCGGTEIGGAYLANTVTKPCVAGVFNTPTLGLDVVILDEAGQPAAEGEMFLVPPSIGMSTSLLNRDHHEIYYEGVPRSPAGEILRRHGDEMTTVPGGWRARGRADDTMNLGGIKVGSAEIERVVGTVPHVVDVAAIAVAPTDGPSQLVIYAVVDSASDPEKLKAAMQDAIRRDLNPLFKIHAVVVIDALPRTASNKVMRRSLRDRYTACL